MALKCWKCYDSYFGVSRGNDEKKNSHFYRREEGKNLRKGSKKPVSLTWVLTKGLVFIRCQSLVVLVECIFICVRAECYARHSKYHGKVQNLNNKQSTMADAFSSMSKSEGRPGVGKVFNEPKAISSKKLICQNYSRSWKAMARYKHSI